MFKYLYYRIVMYYHNHDIHTGTECNQARTAITVLLVIEMLWLLNILEDHIPGFSVSLANMVLSLTVFAVLCEVILYKKYKTLNFNELEKKWENPQKKLLGNIIIVIVLIVHLFLIITL